MLRKLILFSLIGISSYAQDSLSINLAEIKVSANINPTEIQKTARNVTVISAKEIALSPTKTLDGILQYALNVDVRTRSPLGVQADISIRGGHFDQTLIMVDGVKLNDPQTGHHSMNLPVPLGMIDHIEVLQGGASRVYGPSAFSGVINIITKSALDYVAGIDIGAGQNGLYDFGGQLNFTKGKSANFISASKMHSDGYTHNTAFDRTSIYLKSALKRKHGLISLQAGWVDNKFGASNFYHPKFNNQYEETGATFVSFHKTHNFSNKFSSAINASFRQHNDLYDFNNFLETNLNFVNFHKTNVWQIDWKMRYLSSLGASSVGLEWRQEGIISNRLGEEVENPKPVKDYEGIYYTKEKRRENWSVFLEQQKRWEKLMISGGALLNFNSQFGTEIYPGIDLSYFISSGRTLYASANRSLRFPTFTEMYLNTSTVIADPELLPEKAANYEIGYKFFDQKKNLTLSAFYKKTKDAIDKVKRPEEGVPIMENIDDINMFGFEILSQLNIAAKRSDPNSFMQKIQVNYSYLLADRQEDGFQSFYTLNYLSHKATVATYYRLAEGLSASLIYTFKKREGQYQWDADSPPESYKVVHLLDIRLNYHKGWFNAFADLNNALNYDYYEFGFVEQPGIWFSTGVKLRF